MYAKFKPNQKVLYKGQEETVVVSRKDFSTNEITYVLEGVEEMVPEEALKLSTKSEQPKPTKEDALQSIRDEYQKAVGQPVPSNKKNNVEWMQEKTKSAKEAKTEENKQNPSILTWDRLSTLSIEEMQQIIKANGLDIDVEDYDVVDLRIAVAEEMEIEVTE